MDLFTRYRTFFVMFVLIAFISFMLFKYLEQTGTQMTESMTPFLIEDSPSSSNSSSNSSSSNSSVEKNRPKTIKKCPEKKDHAITGWNNTCQFQRVDQFEGFGIIDDIRNNSPNLPIWEDLQTKHTWSPLNVRPDIVKWSELKRLATKTNKVLEIANVSFSFWVYFDESLGKTRPYTSIFQISESFNSQISNPFINSSIAVIGVEARPVLKILYTTDEEPQIKIGNEFSNESDLFGGNQIGYNHLPSFIFITVQNNVIRLYVDGVEQNKFSGGYILPPRDDFVLSSGINFSQNNNKSGGISIRDLQIYGECVPVSNINIIYTSLKSKILAARGWDQEGFSSGYFFENQQGGNFLDKEEHNIFKRANFFEQGNIFKQLSESFSNNTSDFDGAAHRDELDNEQYTSQEIINHVANLTDIKLGSQTVTITNPFLGFKHAKLWSLDGNSCYRSFEEKTPSNNQIHREFDTPIVYKAERTMYIDSKKTKTKMTDVTSQINAALKKPNGKYPPLDVTGQFKLTIYIKNGWENNPTKNTFTLEYVPGRDNKDNFYTTLASVVKCNNKLDHTWDNAARMCKEKPENAAITCSSSRPKCMSYAALKDMGKCAVDNKIGDLVFNSDTTNISDMSLRRIRYISLNEAKNEFLELNVDSKSELDILFSDAGTTFSMWFKANPEKRKTDKGLCRLLDFCNKEWVNTRDNVTIAIDNDQTMSRLRFGVNNNSGKTEWNSDSNTISQVLDNQWHHIVWMLAPIPKTTNSKWTFYHNGKHLGTDYKDRPYPRSIIRNSKIIGGPASYGTDQFWGPSLAELRIFKGILTETQIWKLYAQNRGNDFGE
jgi:hypothetical protein